MDIHRGWRFSGGIIIVLMNRQRKDGLVTSEDSGGAVAVVNVAIHHHGASDFPLALQFADGNRDVVDSAKTFAMIRKSMVEAAADVERHTLIEGQAAGERSATRGEPERARHFR